MAEAGWPRHTLGIGVFEFRRSVRAIWQDKARFAFMALGMLIPTLMVTAFAVVFADAIRGVETLPISGQVRGTVALFWLFAVFMIGQRVVSARTRIEAEPLMLTTVSTRTVAGGLMIAETLRILAYLGLPLFMLTGVGIFLFGSPLSLILVPAAALLFTTTAVVTGTICGYAVAWIVATSRFVTRHKTVLGSAASLILMGGYFLFLYPQIGGVGPEALAWLPFGWFADLAILGTGLLETSLFRPVGVFFSSVLLLLGGSGIVEREATALWFTEPVSINSGETTKQARSEAGQDVSAPSRRDSLAAAVKPLVVPRVMSVPVRRVAEWVLLRTRRDPNRLMFLMIPVFAVGSSLISTGVQSGSIGALLPPICAIILPWLAGSLFAMNPLGDEGAVLPMTLTAVSGRQYVRGLMVPGLFLGLPLVVVATTIAGIFSSYTLTEHLALVALGVYLTCVAVTMTPAIGMTFPRFSAISVGQSQDVLPPRMSAVTVHVTLTVIPGTLLAALIIVPNTARAVLAGLFGFVPAFLLEWLAGSNGGRLVGIAEWFIGFGNAIQALGIVQVRGIGGGAVLIGGVIASILLYQNAVHRFEQYSPE